MPAPNARPSCIMAGRPRIRYGCSFSEPHTLVGSDSSRSSVTGCSHKQPCRPARRNRKGDSVAPGSGMYNAPQTKRQTVPKAPPPPRETKRRLHCHAPKFPTAFFMPGPGNPQPLPTFQNGRRPSTQRGESGESCTPSETPKDIAPPNTRCKDTKKEDARGGTDTLFSFYRNIFRPKQNSRLQHAVPSRFVDPTIRNPARAWRWRLS